MRQRTSRCRIADWGSSASATVSLVGGGSSRLLRAGARGGSRCGVRGGSVRGVPDQHSAAEEYAIFQQITAPTTRLPDDPVRVTAEVDFPVALRGYDRVAVDAYVQRMSHLVAELGATRSPEGAVQRALERVGAQISGVLERARDSAEQITAQSRREAEDRLEVTGQEAVQIVAAAAHRVEDLDAEAERIGAERRLIGDACELAGQLIALTDAANRRFPPNEPEASAQFHAADQAAAPEAPEPDLGVESQLAELWTLAAGQAPDDDLTAVLSPVEADPDAVAKAFKERLGR
jgi:hypothetical protein